MGNSQSLPELPPTYEEFQDKYQAQLNLTPSRSDSSSSTNCTIRDNSRSFSSTICSYANSRNNALQRPNQPLHSDSIETKLSELRNKSDTFGQLLNCRKEDYNTVKELLDMEKEIVNKKEKLEKHIVTTMKKIEKLEKERDKKMMKIKMNR